MIGTVFATFGCSHASWGSKRRCSLCDLRIRLPTPAARYVRRLLYWIGSSTASGFYPPNLKSKSRASSPPTFGSCSPHFRAQPFFSLGSVPSLPPLHGHIRPFSSPISLLCFPMLYSPFPLRFLFLFSFLPLPFPEGPHTQL